LKNIIDKLLDLSRIEGKAMELRYSLVNFNDLLKDSRGYFKELAAEKNISLNYLLPDKEVSIFIDAERIIQVITNLISNAIKFTEENGQIKVDLKVLDDKVRVGVSDTGIGIAKADLSKVFSKFIQVTRADSAGKQGIGLGLSIVKEIIEKHGGEVWVESKMGVGSKFYFTLPLYYTANVLGKDIKKRIDDILDSGIPVHLINMLVVNFEEFKKRLGSSPKKLSQDIKDIVLEVFKRFSWADEKKHEIFIQKGKCSIIFPLLTDKRISDFSNLLKEKTKHYFIENKIENAFIALGILSYPPKSTSGKREKPKRKINIKEIYIGSEMRRYKRVDYETKIDIIFAGKPVESAKTIDMSRAGICFVSKKAFKTDQRVKIKLALLRKKSMINIVGRISWIKKMERTAEHQKDQYKIGLEFVSLDARSRDLLFKELSMYDG